MGACKIGNELMARPSLGFSRVKWTLCSGWVPLGRATAVEIAVEKDLLSRGLRQPVYPYKKLDRRCN